MIYQLRTWLVKYWSPNIHKRTKSNEGFTGYSSKRRHSWGSVCACDKEWDCDSEKTSDRKTKNGGMDSNRVQIQSFEPLYVLDNGWASKAKMKVLIFFVSGADSWLGYTF